jgi:hypothetical protein
MFIGGLLLVSAVKNETRILQKEINNLKTDINITKYNLDQAILDNEVITSPENISILAKEYLKDELVFYKKSQIKKLKKGELNYQTYNETKKKSKKNKIIDNLQVSLKSGVKKELNKKKTEINKLKNLYNDPKSIPKKVKNKVKNKKEELKTLYEAPKEIITLERAGRWTVVQVVKVFLGFPVVPGR